MPGFEELVAGAALGVVFQQLYDVIKDARAKTKKFDLVLKDLQNTVNSVAPKIKEISRMDREHDNFPKQEMIIFLRQLEKGKELVTTCSEIRRWNKIKKRRYVKRLVDLDSSLRRLLAVEFQAEQLLNIKILLSEIAKINEKLDRMNLQRMSSSVSENNKEKPGVSTEDASANPEQSNSQGKKPRFEISFRRKKINRETELKVSFGSKDH